MENLVFKIAPLWGASTGTVINEQLDHKIEYPGDSDLDFAGNFTGAAMFIKMKDEISVLLSNCSIKCNFICQKCLKKFKATIKIDQAERPFLWGSVPDIENDNDVFYINQKAMTLDLREMVRQEIILHFPLIPVCSKSCKGLCEVCGKDKNKTLCNCKPKNNLDNDNNQPFKNLKKLTQASKKKPSAKPSKNS